MWSTNPIPGSKLTSLRGRKAVPAVASLQNSLRIRMGDDDDSLTVFLALLPWFSVLGPSVPPQLPRLTPLDRRLRELRTGSRLPVKTYLESVST